VDTQTHKDFFTYNPLKKTTICLTMDNIKMNPRKLVCENRCLGSKD